MTNGRQPKCEPCPGQRIYPDIDISFVQIGRGAYAFHRRNPRQSVIYKTHKLQANKYAILQIHVLQITNPCVLQPCVKIKNCQRHYSRLAYAHHAYRLINKIVPLTPRPS